MHDYFVHWNCCHSGAFEPFSIGRRGVQLAKRFKIGKQAYFPIISIVVTMYLFWKVWVDLDIADHVWQGKHNAITQQSRTSVQNIDLLCARDDIHTSKRPIPVGFFAGSWSRDGYSIHNGARFHTAPWQDMCWMGINGLPTCAFCYRKRINYKNYK